MPRHGDLMAAKNSLVAIRMLRQDLEREVDAWERIRGEVGPIEEMDIDHGMNEIELKILKRCERQLEAAQDRYFKKIRRLMKR